MILESTPVLPVDLCFEQGKHLLACETPLNLNILGLSCSRSLGVQKVPLLP